MSDPVALAARYAGRPLLLMPSAARELAVRIRASAPRAFARPGRIETFLRTVGLAASGRARPMAMDDDDYGAPLPPMEERLAYAPRWAGEIEDTGFCWSLKSGVALMNCDTPLVARGDEFCGAVYHGYDTLLMAMRDAGADERVKGIFFREETPGGVVDGGLATLSAFMRQAREAAGGKPIWVYADMACSAGYWIGAQADRIIAPAVGYVGSIGAVMVHENWAGALAEEGIEITSIEFPDGGEKTDGAWWKTLSESAKAAWKADVAECGRLFLAEVAAGRPQLTEEVLLATRAGVFMGDHSDPARSGRALGFVDAIAGEEDAFAELVEHVSASGSRTPSARAPGSRAGADTPKEAPMAKTAAKTPAGRTAAQTAKRDAVAKARADLAALEAETSAEDEVAPDDDQVDEAEDDAAEEDDSGDDPETPPADAAAIAASAEGKANPALALSAIQNGLTLAQFKGMAATASTPPQRSSALREAMAGARRLAPDAKGQGGGLGAQLVADAKAKREAAGRR